VSNQVEDDEKATSLGEREDVRGRHRAAHAAAHAEDGDLQRGDDDGDAEHTAREAPRALVLDLLQ